jgi:hypothetical protein
MSGLPDWKACEISKTFWTLRDLAKGGDLTAGDWKWPMTGIERTRFNADVIFGFKVL